MTGNEYLNIKKNTIGIYWFRNIDNNKYYVGQALDIRRRFNKHMSRMRRKFNYPLYNALNKYGLDKFEYHIEFILNPEGKTQKQIEDELNYLEIKYIAKYDSFNNGYNLTIGGESISGYHQSKETKQRLSKIVKEIQNDGRNKIYVYNVLTKEYSKWNTLKEFNNTTNNTNRNLTGNDFVLVDHQWIGAKTKELLQEKIAFWKEYKNIYDNATSRGKFVQKLDYNNEDVLNDLKLLSWKDFCIKYNVSKSTYYNYRKRLNIPTDSSIGEDPRIKYKPEQFIDDYTKLSKEQILNKYGMSERHFYNLKKKYIK